MLMTIMVISIPMSIHTLTRMAPAWPPTATPRPAG